MKLSDLIEALEMTNKVYKEKHGHDMEIYDFRFDDGGEDTMEIVGVKHVNYDRFGGSKTGRKPVETFDIHFSVEEGEIVDRCVEIRI